MKPTVYLFDIDGTLIRSDGAGRRAVEAAFGAHHGRPDACSTFSFAGMTDRAIARRALMGLGYPGEGPDVEAAIDAVLSTYLTLLESEVQAATDYAVHVGIEAALDELARHQQTEAPMALGLGTGNLERGARIKLARVGLEGRFAFGGFGSDAEDRAELLRVGAERGAARLGRSRQSCRVLVIGDTPRDIEAARAISAEVIAVGTGPFSVEQLAQSQPDWTFEHLASPGAIAALLR